MTSTVVARAERLFREHEDYTSFDEALADSWEIENGTLCEAVEGSEELDIVRAMFQLHCREYARMAAHRKPVSLIAAWQPKLRSWLNYALSIATWLVCCFAFAVAGVWAGLKTWKHAATAVFVRTFLLLCGLSRLCFKPLLFRPNVLPEQLFADSAESVSFVCGHAVCVSVDPRPPPCLIRGTYHVGRPSRYNHRPMSSPVRRMRARQAARKHAAATVLVCAWLGRIGRCSSAIAKLHLEFRVWLCKQELPVVPNNHFGYVLSFCRISAGMKILIEAHGSDLTTHPLEVENQQIPSSSTPQFQRSQDEWPKRSAAHPRDHAPDAAKTFIHEPKNASIGAVTGRSPKKQSRRSRLQSGAARKSKLVKTGFSPSWPVSTDPPLISSHLPAIWKPQSSGSPFTRNLRKSDQSRVARLSRSAIIRFSLVDFCPIGLCKTR